MIIPLQIIQGNNDLTKWENSVISLVLYTIGAWIILLLLRAIFISPFYLLKEAKDKIKILDTANSFLGSQKEKITRSSFDIHGKNLAGSWFGQQFILDEPIWLMSLSCGNEPYKSEVYIGAGSPNSLGRFRYNTKGKNCFSVYSTVTGQKIKIPNQESGEFDLIINNRIAIGVEVTDKQPTYGFFELRLLGWTISGKVL